MIIQTVVLEQNGLEVFAQKMFPSFSLGIEWPGTAAEFISAAVIAGKNYQKLKLIKFYPYCIIFLHCVKSYPSIMAWNSNKALLATACSLSLAHSVVSCVASQENLNKTHLGSAQQDGL